MTHKRTWATAVGTLVILLALVSLGVSHYGGNVSGLLHMDKEFGDLHKVPHGVVLYSDGAYDGMLYYQIARDLPALFTGGTPTLNSPYRFQRILLPLLTYIVSFGQEQWFSLALLVINLAAAVCTLLVTLKITRGKTVHAVAAVLNPAMLIGILYMLTEPLSMVCITLFFFVWLGKNQKLSTASLAFLLLSLLARETTVFLIGLLFLWSLWNKQWKQAALLLIPVALFILWQYFLVLRLGSVGFQANNNIVDPPFVGIAKALYWLWQGRKVTYVLSSVGLLLFVLPLLFVSAKEWVQRKMNVSVLCFLVSGLAVTMICMDAHMWGAITSIGRVVTPIYPVYALYAAERDTWVERSLSATLIVVSIVAAIGIAAVAHPFVLS